jgi:hypothetical protein
MPNYIRRLPSGQYKVCEQDKPSNCYSKKGLSLTKAKKQELAIRLSELRKQKKIPPRK